MKRSREDVSKQHTREGRTLDYSSSPRGLRFRAYNIKGLRVFSYIIVMIANVNTIPLPGISAEA